MATFRGAGTPGAGEAMPTEQDLQDAVTAAELAETNAAASAAAASTSETNAGTSETNSGTSETNAGTSETNAAASESAAYTAQIASELAALNAITAQGQAEFAQTNAETAETNAAASYDSFDDRYLGAKTSDPTLDNDGDALLAGAVYWNSTAAASAAWRVYNGSTWDEINQDSYLKSETYSQTESDALFASIERGQSNAIINGDMNIWQRANSFAGITFYKYTADRWIFNPGAATWTCARVVDAPTIAEAGRKINYCVEALVTTAGTDTGTDQASFQYRVEGYDFNAFRDQTFTISFWFKSNVTGTYNVSLRNAGLDRAYVTEFTVDVADTWEQKSFTVDTAPSAGGVWSGTTTTAVYIDITGGSGGTYDTATVDAWQTGNFSTTAAAVNLGDTLSNYMRLTGVKMELGAVVTPAPSVSYEADLRRCQRYFEKSYDQGVALGTVSSLGMSAVYMTGLASAANSADATVTYAVTKRATPSIVMYSQTTGAQGKARDNVAGADVTPTTAQIGTSGFRWIATMSAAATSVILSAQWAADAEL